MKRILSQFILSFPRSRAQRKALRPESVRLCARGGKQGVTMLFVVIILAAVLSIGLGIANILFGNLLISGEVVNSFQALYAADYGVEKLLYLDRQSRVLTFPSTKLRADVSSGACYEYTATKILGVTTLLVYGKYPCTAGKAIVKRGFLVTY